MYPEIFIMGHEEDIINNDREQRQDMLLLAQQKLDEINRGNLGLSGGGRNHRSKRSAVSSTLLSTLLYIAIMAHKLEDMKTMLEEEDLDMYNEWRCLFDNLHSPEFHTQERILQNQRVKTAFTRKRHYKNEATSLEKELLDTSSRLTELQKLSNDTNNEMSKSINTLQAERASLVTIGEERRNQMEELNAKISELQKETDIANHKLQLLQSDVDRKDELLQKKNQTITNLEGQMSQYKQDVAVATTNANHTQSSLDLIKVQLQESTTKYESDRVEMEKLQQELTESQSLNAVLHAKLDAANKSLDVANQSIHERTSATQASIDDIKAQNDNLRDIVQSGMAKLNGSMEETKTVMEETKCDVGKVLAHNQQVSGTLGEITNKATSSISDLGHFSNEIQQGLLNVKQTLDDLTRHQQNNNNQHHQDVSNVQQRLDAISDELQHIGSITSMPLAAEQLATHTKEGGTSDEFHGMSNDVAEDECMLDVKEGIEGSKLSQLETNNNASFASVNRSFLSISSEEMVENFVSEAKSVVLSRSP